MTLPQVQILGILAITIVLFMWGRWRHDLVALASLLACVVLGLVGPETAFSGFGHPAVITVASVLILSRGLQETGVVSRVADRLLPQGVGTLPGIAALVGLGAVMSAFMNNVGAMALLLPLALQLADRFDLSPSRVLMPLAFGTILGGMTTLIGTPPNLIVSGFREASGAGSFGMFDFAPVGAAVAVAGVLFVSLLGWRLVPERAPKGVEAFDTGVYLVEALVKEGSSAIGKTLRQADDTLGDSAQIVGLFRGGTRLNAPNPRRLIQRGDVLVIEVEPDDLSSALSALDLSLGEPAEADDVDQSDGDGSAKSERGDAVVIREFVVMQNSDLVRRSSAGLDMGIRYGLTLLAVSRQGQRSIRSLKTMRFQPGDLLLLQGPPEALAGFASQYNLVPLASRDIRLPQPSRALTASAIMGLAIALVAFGVLSAPVSFALGVLAMGVTGIIPPRDLYEAVDWPVVILLAALIPVAGAMSSTGTADLMADTLLNRVADGAPLLAVALILVVTMTLSDFMNNAATAAVMCPIAISGAAQLGVSSEPFLMAVAIGASCAFLTPIGHQNNTLILGPGGLHFRDYWRLGLPMEILVVAISVPLLPLVWPF